MRIRSVSTDCRVTMKPAQDMSVGAAQEVISDCVLTPQSPLQRSNSGSFAIRSTSDTAGMRDGGFNTQVWEGSCASLANNAQN